MLTSVRLSEVHTNTPLGQARLSWSGGLVAGSEMLGIRLKLSTAGAWVLLSLAINRYLVNPRFFIKPPIETLKTHTQTYTYLNSFPLV